MVKNLNIGTKTAIGILALIAFGIGVVAVSMLSIDKINTTLNQITDVAAPTVETAADVTYFVKEAHKIGIEILADEELSDIEQRTEQFTETARMYEDAIAELDEIVSDPMLQTTLEESTGEWLAFDTAARGMFASHVAELEEELKAKELLASFEVGGTELIDRLAEIANVQEVEMQAAENRADELASITSTTALQLNDLIGELFEMDYPAYEAAVQLQLIVAVLEGAAREYMASEDREGLEDIRKEFTDAYANVAPAFAVLAERAENDAEREQIAKLEVDLETWVQRTQADEQLFDTHRDMLEAELEADLLAEEMNSAAAILIETLDAVASAADAVSDGADELAAQQVQTARVTVLVLLAGMIAVGAAIAVASVKLISGPIQKLTQTMELVSSGDLSAELERSERTHEIGKMTNAMVIFLENEKKSRELDASLKAKDEQEAALKKQAAEREAEREAELAREKEAREKAAADERAAMMHNLGESIGTVVSEAKAGNFSSRIEAKFDDETLVALSSNINELLDAVDTGLSAAGKTLASIAEGDLTQTMGGEFQGAFKDLQNNTNSMITSLKELTGGIVGSTDTLSHSSNELRDTSDALAKQAEQNAASLEETSAALEELSASIKQVDMNISEANENSRSASETAQSARVVASEAGEAMQRIQKASVEISTVVGVINDISFQINLLALNAGVEAARAGDAGRGFSVVASEVRQLAQRASEASSEIAGVISRSDTAVTDGVAKVTDAENSLQKITDSVIEVSGSIGAVATAISEQANGIAEINAAVGQIDQNTQKQAASFEEVTAASKLLSEEVAGLQQSASSFKTGTNVVRLEQKNKSAQISSEKPKYAASSAGNLAEETGGEWENF